MELDEKTDVSPRTSEIARSAGAKYTSFPDVSRDSRDVETPRRKQMWRASKILSSLLLLIFLPTLVLDSFLDNFFSTRAFVLLWYVLDTNAENREYYFKAIRETWKRWCGALLFFTFSVSLPFVFAYGTWRDLGGDSFTEIWLIRGVWGIPAILGVIFITFVTNRQDDYRMVDFPSKAIRFRNWQNLVAILSAIYDLFTLMSLFVRPEVPYPKSSNVQSVFAQRWQSLGIDTKSVSFWLAFSLAWIWVLIAQFSFWLVDIKKDQRRALNNKLMQTLIPLFSNSLYLYISVNLLQGLKSYADIEGNAQANFLEEYNAVRQQRITVCALWALAYYNFTAMLYGGLLNAKSDNIFADSKTDVKYKQSYLMTESILKSFLAASNIFTTGRNNLLVPSLVFSLVVCGCILFLVITTRPCCIQSINVLKAVIFALLTWGSFCSLIAVAGFSDATTTVKQTWTPVILLFIGWGIILSTTGYYYWKKRWSLDWSAQPDQLYVWGFNPKSRDQVMWWQARKPARVETPPNKWRMASCGTLPYTLAVSQEGALYSTGIADRGQLGHGDDTYRYLFQLVHSLWIEQILVRSVSCGFEHALVLTVDGKVYSMGRGDLGQLGQGPTARDTSSQPEFPDSMKPRLVDLTWEEHYAIHVEAGANHSAIVTRAGHLYTFGKNSQGQLGHGTEEETKVFKPTRVNLDLTQSVVSVSLGASHTMILTMAESDKKQASPIELKTAEATYFLYGVGSNEFGQLGIGGDTKDYFTPQLVTEGLEGSKIVMVASGGFHTLALSAEGKVFTWGCGDLGQLGHGDLKSRNTPTPLDWSKYDQSITIHSIAAGSNHSALISSNYQLYTFGGGENFCLGYEATDVVDTKDKKGVAVQKTPQLVESLKDVTSVSMGGNHCIAVTKGRRLYTWGTSNPFCGLGYSADSDECVAKLPELVECKLDVDEKKHEKIKSIDLGGDHGGLITTEGRVFMWGTYNQGQLGLGEIENIASEVKLQMEEAEKSREVKSLTSEGTLSRMKSSALKDIPQFLERIQRPTCLKYISNYNVTQISCGWFYTALVTDDGTCWSFGANGEGQLGHGQGHPNQMEPKPIEWFREQKLQVKKIATANFHTVCITECGKVFAWGSDGRAIDRFYQESLGVACVGLIGQGGPVQDCRKLAQDTKRPDLRYWDPTQVFGELKDKKACDVSAGFAHSSVVTEDGGLYTWGFGYFAVLGHGDRDGRNQPTLVKFPQEVIIKESVCGLIHTSALDRKGRLWTFGMGGHSQLGHGDTEWKTTPALVETLSQEDEVVNMSAGTYQTAAVLANGQVFVAGSYLLGALGLGDVHRPQMSFRIVGSLLGRTNHKVSCGNHSIAAF